jgi:hypothetical protein
MRTILLAIATILSLGTGTAMAEIAPVQQVPIGSTHIDMRGSDEIRSRHPFATTGGDHPKAETGAQATQPAASDEEPESISQGTEP